MSTNQTQNQNNLTPIIAKRKFTNNIGSINSQGHIQNFNDSASLRKLINTQSPRLQSKNLQSNSSTKNDDFFHKQRTHLKTLSGNIKLEKDTKTYYLDGERLSVQNIASLLQISQQQKSENDQTQNNSSNIINNKHKSHLQDKNNTEDKKITDQLPNLLYKSQDETYVSPSRKEITDKAFQYELQDFFNDQEDSAKMKATIQFDFMYPQQSQTMMKNPQSVWMKLMNIILEQKHQKYMLQMINFTHNEFEILNKNMPFIYKNNGKSQEQIKNPDSKEDINSNNDLINPNNNNNNSHRRKLSKDKNGGSSQNYNSSIYNNSTMGIDKASLRKQSGSFLNDDKKSNNIEDSNNKDFPRDQQILMSNSQLEDNQYSDVYLKRNKLKTINSELQNLQQQFDLSINRLKDFKKQNRKLVEQEESQDSISINDNPYVSIASNVKQSRLSLSRCLNKSSSRNLNKDSGSQLMDRAKLYFKTQNKNIRLELLQQNKGMTDKQEQTKSGNTLLNKSTTNNNNNIGEDYQQESSSAKRSIILQSQNRSEIKIPSLFDKQKALQQTITITEIKKNQSSLERKSNSQTKSQTQNYEIKQKVKNQFQQQATDSSIVLHQNSQEDINDRTTTTLVDFLPQINQPTPTNPSLYQQQSTDTRLSEQRTLEDAKLSYNNASNVFDLKEIQEYLRQRKLITEKSKQNFDYNTVDVTSRKKRQIKTNHAQSYRSKSQMRDGSKKNIQSRNLFDLDYQINSQNGVSMINPYKQTQKALEYIQFQDKTLNSKLTDFNLFGNSRKSQASIKILKNSQRKKEVNNESKISKNSSVRKNLFISKHDISLPHIKNQYY